MTDLQPAQPIVTTCGVEFAGQNDITLSALLTSKPTVLDTFVTRALAARPDDVAAFVAAGQARRRFPNGDTADGVTWRTSWRT
jgi:hypothetical protein